MSVEVIWDTEEHTAFRWIFGAEWNWAEYNAAQAASNELVKTIDYAVDVIVDARVTRAVPSGMFTSIRMNKADHPEKMGQIVIVTENAFITTMAKTLSKLNHQFGGKISFSADIKSARELLKNRHFQQK